MQTYTQMTPYALLVSSESVDKFLYSKFFDLKTLYLFKNHDRTTTNLALLTHLINKQVIFEC